MAENLETLEQKRVDEETRRVLLIDYRKGKTPLMVAKRTSYNYVCRPAVKADNTTVIFFVVASTAFATFGKAELEVQRMINRNPGKYTLYVPEVYKEYLKEINPDTSIVK